MNEDALIRPGWESTIFYRPMSAMTRYLEADVERRNGHGLSPDLMPIDGEAFIDALDLVYNRLTAMTHDEVKGAILAQSGHFTLLQDYLDWIAKRSLRDASPELCQRLVEARSRVQYELGRLRIVYLAPQGSWPGYWTVLGERVELPTAPDYPPTA